MTTTTEVIAYKRDPWIKRKYLDRVLEHQRLDQIIQGEYWDPIKGRGCSVGCTLHSNNHKGYERELGFPLNLIYLQETIFEALSEEDARFFPYAFLSSIEVGADLSDVFRSFVRWILTQLPCDQEDPWLLSLFQHIDEGASVHFIGLSLLQWYRTIKPGTHPHLECIVFDLSVACRYQNEDILLSVNSVFAHLSMIRRKKVSSEQGNKCLFQVAREARDTLFAILRATQPVKEEIHV